MGIDAGELFLHAAPTGALQGAGRQKRVALDWGSCSGAAMPDAAPPRPAPRAGQEQPQLTGFAWLKGLWLQYQEAPCLTC